MPSVLIGSARIQILPDFSHFQQEVQSHNSRIVGAMTSIGKTGAAAIGVGLGAAIGVGVKTAADLEQANVAFTTLLGSGKKASDFLNNLKKFSAATPFELPGLVDASRQLLGVGENADKVIPTLTAWGDTAGALGISQDAFNRSMLAVTQSMANGKIQAGDMLQITQAGIPIWSIMARALGKPVSEVRKLSEHGKLLTKDVLPKLEKQMEKDYGGSMAKQSKTLTGLWSTLTDTFKIGMATALQPMIPLLKEGVGGATKFLGKAFSEVPVIIGKAQPVLSSIGHVISTSVIPALVRIGTAVGPPLKAIIGVIIDFARTLIVRVGPPLMAFGRAVLGVLVPLGALILRALVPTFKVISAVLGATLIPALVGLLRAGTATINWIKGLREWLIPIGILIVGFALSLVHASLAIGIFSAATKVAAALTKAWTIAQAIFNAVMDANVIVLVITAIIALGVALVIAYKKSETFRAVIKAVFDWLIGAGKAIGAWFSGPFVRFFTETVVNGFKSVLNWVKKNWPYILGALTGPIGLAVVWIIKHWGQVRDFFSTAWGTIKRNVLNPIIDFFTKKLVDAARSMRDGIKNHIRIMTLFILDQFGNIIHGAAKLFGWVPGVGGKLKQASRAFDKFRDDVNRALGGVADRHQNTFVTFHGKSIAATSAGRLATGGPIYGRGTETSDDNLILASKGEHMWSAKEVMGAGGHRALERLRAMARAGVLKGLIREGIIPGFAAGGAVGVTPRIPSNKSITTTLNTAYDRMVTSSYAALHKMMERLIDAMGLGGKSAAAALRWARTQVGKPYIWGGVGPRGYDCSGFQGAIQGVLQGQNPYRRRWATGAFSGGRAPAGWQRGLRSAYEVGITNAGVGHTAGTLAKVNVESSGGVGVRVGGGARGAHNGLFPAWYGWRALRYDRGGVLPPGATLALNGLGRNEYISPDRETTLHVNHLFENHGVIGSQYELENWLVSAFEQLQRKGRIRIVTQPGR